MRLRDLTFHPSIDEYEKSQYLLRPDGRRARVWRHLKAGRWVYSECCSAQDPRYGGEGAWTHHKDLTPLEVRTMLSAHHVDPHQGSIINLDLPKEVTP
ncbi:hypothetical protein [Methylobacterium sp. 285MFTsu5.1]|uniref:hypothetical protein n=1 Tax=Methylobacterium sp. 285MFTsu5.1 TaxID=1172187 RepID=UPI00035F9B4D|nr:hypothetical protein [Methylobacterium sp. 285MFTsu5.1]